MDRCFQKINQIKRIGLLLNRIETTFPGVSTSVRGYLPASISLEMVKEKLKKEGITHGVVADGEIVKWLDGDPTEKTPLLIAVGTPPLLPVHATVHYHFDVNYLHVGQIDEDGNIDFRERGNTPFVKAG